MTACLPTEKPKCRRATIAVRRPRVTAPSAAAVGRARALPAWRAAALAARRAAGWSRRTPRVTWVLPRRGLKRWRAPTVAPADRRARHRARASPPRGDIAAAQALSFALECAEQPSTRRARIRPSRGRADALWRHQEATLSSMLGHRSHVSARGRMPCRPMCVSTRGSTWLGLGLGLGLG